MIKIKEDKLKVIIKELFCEGDVFKSKTEIYLKIGLDNLGIKNLNGGKQRNLAFDIVSQYMRIELLDAKKHLVVCAEIYDEPKYMIREDNRGRHGFYIDRTIPILISTFKSKESQQFTMNQISKMVGLSQYSIVSYDAHKDELQNLNSKITSNMFNQFNTRYKRVAEKVVYGALDRLANYEVITYKRRYFITTEKETRKISNDITEKIIKQAETEILDKYEFDNKYLVYSKGKQKSFYDDVLKLINNKHNLKWKRYISIIDIKFDIKKLKKYKNDISDDVEMLKKEIREHFASYLVNVTEIAYQNRNALADIELEEWISNKNNINVGELIVDKNLKEWYDAGAYTDEEILEMHKPKIFKYHSNYLDIQSAIIEYFVGAKTYMTNGDASEWLEAI